MHTPITIPLTKELELLVTAGYKFDHPWQVVDQFEKKIANFFGALYAVAIDSCTHALELSVRLLDLPQIVINIPTYTYMSVPMALEKIRQPWKFCNNPWKKFYTLDPLPIIDAAFLWEKNSYISNTLTCISFQFKKHIPIGRGGMILTDNLEYYNKLQKLCRDGRNRELLQEDDDVEEIGYHYYMTPEDAARGILLFDQLHARPTRVRVWGDYKNLTEYAVFKKFTIS